MPNISFVAPEWNRLSFPQRSLLETLARGKTQFSYPDDRHQIRTAEALVRRGYAEPARTTGREPCFAFKITREGRRLVKEYQDGQATASFIMGAIREGDRERRQKG